MHRLGDDRYFYTARAVDLLQDYGLDTMAV